MQNNPLFEILTEKTVRVTVNNKTYTVKKGTCLSNIPEVRGLIEHHCGGHGKCGKCHVKVSGLSEDLSDTEYQFLSDTEIADGIRLACCTYAENDCNVTAINKTKELQIRIRGNMPEIFIDTTFSSFGAAIDIGTTTLAGRLYSADGNLIAESGCPNPQSVWGADVVSRIEEALHSPLKLETAIHNAIDNLIKMLSNQAEISSYEIDGLVITGNTAMLHFLTGTSVEPLSHAPFELKRDFGEALSAETIGLTSVKSNTEVYLPKCAGAFVGADIMTALLADQTLKSENSRMLVDIGTNGEIALWHNRKLYLCSTAAGPAFEGVGISMGMQGKNGAIDRVNFDKDKLNVHVIGDVSPLGICGSGIVDAIACMLKRGKLDETGLLEESPAEILPPVYINQKDIRAVQLAKSAIHAGIRTLLYSAGIGCNDIEYLAVAGGFGSYLNIENAAFIGLLPLELVNKVRVIGNAALDGAAMLLLNRNYRDEHNIYIKNSEVVELSSNQFFAEEYIERMMY